MQPQPAKAPIDEARLHAILGKVVGDFGAAMSCALTLTGEKLGLYRALAQGPLTSDELALKTGTNERQIREWLMNQAAGGYIEYDKATKRYALPPEHALVLADEDGPFNVLGGFQLVSALLKSHARIEEAFRTGDGMSWGEHHPDLFTGTERFFRPTYVRNLVSAWIPAFEGLPAKLERGARVADVGCGHGASTLIMATAFPKSTFVGYDSHGPSIERARAAAKKAGVSDRVTFEEANATSYDGKDFDLVCFFDCLHDMGEPGKALLHARKALAPGGSLMIVEPMAGDNTEDNFNPIGRVFSGASAMCCTPNAMATGTTWLGTIAPDASFAKLAKDAGLGTFRRAWEDPFNRVFEAKE